MHPDLLHLAELNRVDLELDRVSVELEAARRASGEAATAQGEATRARDAARTALDEARTREGALIRKLDAYKSRKAGALRVLETGVGDPDAAEKQIEQCDTILDDTETELLYLMEELDRLRLGLDASERALTASGVSRADVDRESPARIAALEAEQAALQGRRDGLFAELPHDLKQRYPPVRKRRRTAVARVAADGSCSGCRMQVQLQQIADIKRGLVETCRGCGRWLLVE